MKSFFRIVFSLSLSLLVQSCKSKNPTRTKEAEVIWRLQHDKAQPDHVRNGAGIMLDVLNENPHINFRDYFDAKRQVSSVRNTATVRAWIALLNSTENKIPNSLPSAEEIDRESLESNRKNIGVIYYNAVTRLSLLESCISSLASLDMPEAKAEIKAFLQRFELKYGASSGGKKMLDQYKIEVSQQEGIVRKGTAPWQVGPNPSGGCD